jgi:hypothetical protein
MKLTPTQEVLDFLKAVRCRVVFRRIKTAGLGTAARKQTRRIGSALHVVDYDRSHPEPRVKSFEGTRAFSPELSADGGKVVFTPSFAAGKIVILDLALGTTSRVGMGANPSWWEDPRTANSHVIYRTETAAYEHVPLGVTLCQRVDGDAHPVGAPQQICSHGFGGGRSPDGRYLATGFRHLVVADLQEGCFYQPLGERQLPEKRNQVCSVSLHPRGLQRVMHLRLPHEIFGVVDFSGDHYTAYRIPQGQQEWQTPRWTNHPDYATASALNSEGDWNVYLIDLSNDARLPLTLDGGYIHAHLRLESDPA